MKRSIILILCLLLLSSCASAPEGGSGQRDMPDGYEEKLGQLSPLSLPELPLKELPELDEAMEYINRLSPENSRAYLRALLEYLSFMSEGGQQEVLKESFDAFASGQKLLPLESWEIGFENTLQMNTACNQKYFAQIYAEIEVYYDPSETQKESAAVEQFFLSARDALKSSVVGYYRLAGVEIVYRSKEGSYRNDRRESYTWGGTNRDLLYDEIAWQPEGEKEAQTIAYDFVWGLDKELFGESGIYLSYGRQIFLTRFGIKDGRLYIGLSSHSPLPQGVKGSLDERFSQLVNDIKKEERANYYIEQNGLEGAVIEVDDCGRKEAYEYVF